ncbi:hypothetical protein DL93DRAFT_2162390 [Clavulina sp. PMI_390]|nr:hypothetical protein DL93DRAFT_2162390 [Clavulina sp. PMI_390]
MAIDDHVRRGHPVLFGFMLLLALVEIAISGFLVGRYNTRHDFPNLGVRDRTRFLLFCSIWTFFLGIFYLVLFLHSASTGSVATSVGSHLGFLVLTWIFWTAGAAAITAALNGGHNCSNLKYNLPYCNQLNALEGFAWAEWIVVTIALIAVISLTIRALRRGGTYNDQLV